MTITLNLKPEVQAGLSAEARTAGMTLERYLQQMVERQFSSDPMESEPSEGSGTVWENGLLVYRTGKPLPAHFVDDAIRSAREERARHILGDLS